MENVVKLQPRRPESRQKGGEMKERNAKNQKQSRSSKCKRFLSIKYKKAGKIENNSQTMAAALLVKQTHSSTKTQNIFDKCRRLVVHEKKTEKYKRNYDCTSSLLF